jgi:hypothetical protein
MLEDIFLLLIFTVLCGILVALWRIREQLEKMALPPHSDSKTKEG